MDRKEVMIKINTIIANSLDLVVAFSEYAEELERKIIELEELTPSIPHTTKSEFEIKQDTIRSELIKELKALFKLSGNWCSQ